MGVVQARCSGVAGQKEPAEQIFIQPPLHKAEDARFHIRSSAPRQNIQKRYTIQSFPRYSNTGVTPAPLLPKPRLRARGRCRNSAR